MEKIYVPEQTCTSLEWPWHQLPVVLVQSQHEAANCGGKRRKRMKREFRPLKQIILEFTRDMDLLY